jgi:malonyl-CoA/methylmalonyl-CoA synthetase
MANPLYDTLFGAHAGRSDTFLKLADGSEWSYAAFLANAARFAHALTGAGLAPGDRLAAQIHKSPEALALYAACAQAGIIFLPLNTAYTVDELSYFIENSGARMVVCDEATRAALTPVADRLSAPDRNAERRRHGQPVHGGPGMPGVSHRRPRWRSPCGVSSIPPARRAGRRARC